MSCHVELPLMVADLTIVSQEDAFLLDPTGYLSTGVGSIDFVADVRDVALGASAAMSIKPAVQLAAVRTDRPDAAAAISAGSVITAAGLYPFRETLSAASKFWFRRGWLFKLTAGSFARAQTVLHTSFRSCGKHFDAKEAVFNPLNDVNLPSYFPLTGPFSAVGMDVAKAAVVGLDNLNNKLEWRLAGRGFNDRNARGSWVNLMAGWQTTSAGDFEVNTGEVSRSGLSLTSNHWMELALGVRKNADADQDSRCIFHVLPAVKYT